MRLKNTFFYFQLDHSKYIMFLLWLISILTFLPTTIQLNRYYLLHKITYIEFILNTYLHSTFYQTIHLKNRKK